MKSEKRVSDKCETSYLETTWSSGKKFIGLVHFYNIFKIFELRLLTKISFLLTLVACDI